MENENLVNLNHFKDSGSGYYPAFPIADLNLENRMIQTLDWSCENMDLIYISKTLVYTNELKKQKIFSKIMFLFTN